MRAARPQLGGHPSGQRRPRTNSFIDQLLRPRRSDTSVELGVGDGGGPGMRGVQEGRSHHAHPSPPSEKRAVHAEVELQGCGGVGAIGWEGAAAPEGRRQDAGF